ncbi:MAG: tRNA (N6-isopentenyl adenosine(37)-C2)-methylthiotransferase MiaB [Bacteroidales bacterium]|nr:tRNA (N6-isopentenyl adenosine(37)-C2)-methylthiotransferase MiaB [Bacteroidales bacterium]
MKKIYIETYGCQMNVSDSEVIFAILAKAGYERTEDMAAADVILANTCSIRDNAEQRIWSRLELFAAQKKRRPEVLVGIVGCMAERLKEKLLDSRKVDIVAGPDAYRSLPALLEAAAPDNPQINVLLSREETYGDIMPLRTDRGGVSAFISIMRGCNNVCSYCVVPYTRGAERSRDPETILAEARDVYERGYREVTLLGQNVDSYFWKSAAGNTDFADLLESVARIAPDLRVRYATSHPKDISDKLIETMGRYANICRCIHLPVQSGSDVMLEKMRRRYTREWYLDRVRKIREVMPDCAITTDVIAGFCGETEKDHQDTLGIMREVGYDYAYMFAYSERPGTLAARNYPDDIPPEVKNRRLTEIIDLQNELSLQSNSRDLGKTFEVLVEGPSKRDPSDLCGRNSQNKMCVFPAPGATDIRPGTYVTVRILSCTSATLLGELV